MYGFEKALASIVVHYNTSGRGYMLKSDLDIEEKDLLILESKNLIRLTRYIDGNARINLTPGGWLYYESNLSGGNSNGCAETESKGKSVEDSKKKPFYKSAIFWTAAGVVVAAIGVIIAAIK